MKLSLLFCLMVFRGVIAEEDDGNEIVIRYRKLVNSIFTDSYSTDIRPSKDFLKPTNVTLTLNLRKIVDFDHQNQVLSMDFVVNMVWSDEFLKWDLDEYKFSFIKVDLYDIWTPILMHLTSAEADTFAANWGRSKGLIKYTGQVYGSLRILLKVLCPLDLSDFPYDTQKCTIVLTDRLHQLSSVNYTKIRLIAGKNRSIEREGEWSLFKTEVERIKSSFVYVFYIRRQPIGHLYFFMLPYITSVLFSIAVFLSPVGSNYRLWYGGIALYILTELLFESSEIIGSNSFGIPYIVKCLGLNTIFVGISLTLTTFIYQIMMNFSHSCPRLPNVLIDFLNNRLIMIMFGIDGPQPRKQIELENGKDIEETDEISKDLVDTKVKTIEEWMQMIQFTDRILFILYIITVIVYHA